LGRGWDPRKAQPAQHPVDSRKENSNNAHRMDVTDDDELRRVLEHNRDEEKEHASMLLEWIRRRDTKFDKALRTYLFTTGDILGIEEKSEKSDS
jgi:hypothetical protein